MSDVSMCLWCVHANENRQKDDKIRCILDTRKSCLSTENVRQFKCEITKQKSTKICEDMSTMEVSQIGANCMVADGFRLAKGQFDV